MYKKIVAIEPISLLPAAKEALKDYAKEVELYTTYPKDDNEICDRIGDADAVLVSYTTNISKHVIERSSGLKYIGMCCSLYSEASANVDIASAREHGITVTGIRDYGDEGVVEFVISELVQLLHGYREPMWSVAPRELTGMKVGIIGLGTSGRMVADGLRYFGAEVYYYSRTLKPEAQEQGIEYMELNELLTKCEVICTCLNKNTVLLGQEQFKIMGERKILINTGLSPSFEMEEFKKWIKKENYFICDTKMALGDDGTLFGHANIRCVNQSSGMTRQAYKRLSDKVLENIKQNMNV